MHWVGRAAMSQRSAMNDVAANAAPSVVLYGTQWCGDCHRSRRLLDRLGVPYTYVDVNADPDAADWVRANNRGFQSVPTIALGSEGPILVEPSDQELHAALNDAGFLAAQTNGADRSDLR